MELLAVALWLALGAPTAWALRRAGGGPVALAALPLAGTLALLLPLLALAWWTGPLSLWGPLALGASALLGVGVAAGLRGRRRSPGVAPPEPRALALAAAPVGVCALALAGAGVVLSGGWPGYGWDGLAIWLVRAKVLAESATFPAPLFSEPLLAGSHWDYPLALPALVAAQARLADLDVRAYATALGAVLAVFPVAGALGALRLLPPPFAAALALAPLAVPALVRIHFEGYADPLLVVVGTWGVVFAVGATLRRDGALALLAGLALAVAVSVKNEGVLWWGAAVVGASGAALATGRSRGAPRMLAPVALPGLALFVLWRGTCVRLGAESDLAGALRPDLALARLPVVLEAAARALLASGAGLGVLLCAAAVVVAVGGRGRARALRAAALLAAPLAYLAGLSCVYLATPYDVRWHLATSLPRTLLGAMPLFLAAAVLALPLRDALEERRGPPRTGRATRDGVEGPA